MTYERANVMMFGAHHMARTLLASELLKRGVFRPAYEAGRALPLWFDFKEPDKGPFEKDLVETCCDCMQHVLYRKKPQHEAIVSISESDKLFADELSKRTQIRHIHLTRDDREPVHIPKNVRNVLVVGTIADREVNPITIARRVLPPRKVAVSGSIVLLNCVSGKDIPDAVFSLNELTDLYKGSKDIGINFFDKVKRYWHGY